MGLRTGSTSFGLRVYLKVHGTHEVVILPVGVGCHFTFFCGPGTP